MQKITAYMRVYLGIKKKIKNGSYKPGTLLPTEAELEKIYEVSRITVRRAVQMLANEGYVNVVQGKGTEICDTSTIQRLSSVTSITETLKSKGYHVSLRSMSIEEVAAPPKAVDKLKLDKDATVYCVNRILCADGKPIAIMVNYLKKDYIPELKKYENTFVGLYDFLERTYGIVMTEAYEQVSAENADFLESQVLEIPMGSALLCSERVGFTARGPFEYAVSKLISEKYEFSVHLVGRR